MKPGSSVPRPRRLVLSSKSGRQTGSHQQVTERPGTEKKPDETKSERENTEGSDINPPKNTDEGYGGDYSSIISYYKPKIRYILEKHPEGVSTSVFLQEFEEEYGRPFDYVKLGYFTMEIMVISRKDLFDYEKAKDSEDFTIFAARENPPHFSIGDIQWITVEAQSDVAALSKQDTDNVEAQSDLAALSKQDTDNVEAQSDLAALSKQDTDNGYFKEYECDHSFKYSPPSLPVEEVVEVMIVDIRSPGLFWIQFLRDVKRLDDLMGQMTVHYRTEEETYHLSDQYIEPGLAVAIFFKGTSQWHRARIESCETDKVKVLYVDFGTLAHVERCQLRKLDRRFAQEPICAVKASMYLVVPPLDTKTWPEESYDFLYDNYSDIPLFARICERDIEDPTDPSIQVLLYRIDSRNHEEECVNQTFVTKLFGAAELVKFSKYNSALLGQFLPLWMTTSTKREHDKDSTFSALRMTVEPRSNPVNADQGPCCLRHIVQTFFQANPIEVGKLWKKVYLKNEVKLLGHVCAAMLPNIDELEWAEFLASPISCVGGNTDRLPNPSPTEDIETPQDTTPEDSTLKMSDASECSNSQFDTVSSKSFSFSLSENRSALSSPSSMSWDEYAAQIPPSGVERPQRGSAQTLPRSLPAQSKKH